LLNRPIFSIPPNESPSFASQPKQPRFVFVQMIEIVLGQFVGQTVVL